MSGIAANTAARIVAGVAAPMAIVITAYGLLPSHFFSFAVCIRPADLQSDGNHVPARQMPLCTLHCTRLRLREVVTSNPAGGCPAQDCGPCLSVLADRWAQPC